MGTVAVSDYSWRYFPSWYTHYLDEPCNDAGDVSRGSVKRGRRQRLRFLVWLLLLRQCALALVATRPSRE